MKRKDELIQMVKHIIRRDKGIPDRRLMHPGREWSVGVMLLGLLCVGGGVYAFSVFANYSSISVETERVEVDQLQYKRADAQAAIDLYQNRNVLYREIVLRINNFNTTQSEASENPADENSEEITESLAEPDGESTSLPPEEAFEPPSEEEELVPPPGPPPGPAPIF